MQYFVEMSLKYKILFAIWNSQQIFFLLEVIDIKQRTFRVIYHTF